MSSLTREQFDVLVVGGGPAGLAAATRAAECGLQVGLVDDNPALGGADLARRSREHAHPRPLTGVSGSRLPVHACFAGPGCFISLSRKPCWRKAPDGALELKYKKLILATGARERFLPFPGWTLPNVMGARRGLQALVKSGLPIAGKRVVVAGSGPLLLAVAAYLRQHGAEIPVICEQASWSSLASFGLALLRQPQKVRQGFALRKQLAGIPFAPNSWPVSARGQVAVEEVVISQSGKKKTIACDYLACGFHLVPNSELAALLGCRVQDDLVEVDDHQRTSVAGIFCAGEPTGIGGLELSLVEGQIAGLAAAGRETAAQPLFAEREKLRRFAACSTAHSRCAPTCEACPFPKPLSAGARTSPARAWLRTLRGAPPNCSTRCGMGPCQARICGPASRLPVWLGTGLDTAARFSHPFRKSHNLEPGNRAQ